MQGYVVLLRGINTGKLNIKKVELKVLLEPLKFDHFDVIGHTGNIIVYSTDSIDHVKTLISHVLEKHFGQMIFMHIRSISAFNDIKSVIKPIKDGMQHYIVFCEEYAQDELYQYYMSMNNDIEVVYKTGRDLYWITPKGYTLKGFGKVALGRAKYKKKVTSRNVNTILKMIEVIKCD